MPLLRCWAALAQAVTKNEKIVVRVDGEDFCTYQNGGVLTNWEGRGLQKHF